MKDRRFLSWRWCPHPERMKSVRTRPIERSWAPLIASALILSLLAIQGIQPWIPSAVNIAYPNNYANNYAAFQTAEPAISSATPEAKEPSEIISIVTTEHIDVQLSFPDSASPGQMITLSATSTARSGAKVTSLIIEIYAYADRQLVRVASETVLTNKQVRSGDSWQTAISFSVPNSAQRSAIIGTVEETWEKTTTTYYSSYPLTPYAPYYYPPYPYYNYTVYYAHRPSYVIREQSSLQTIPLTYVLATTPEYETLTRSYEQLQNDHEELATQYNDLVSKYNDLVSGYDSLRSEYDMAVSRYNELQSDHNSAIAELNSYKTYAYVLAVVAVALGAAVVFCLLLWRRRSTEPPQNAKDLRAS